MCDAHPWGDPKGLTCLRTDPHTTGHVYNASDAPDRHREPTEGDH